ncbi:MAG: hypothetical protein ABSF70_10635 [Terracidiphilus sp.]|jgi:hypothetical protein
MAITDTVKLEIKGSTQKVRMCAERTGLPPLLIVQAGPGLPLLHEVRKFQQHLQLEKDFLVSYWEQRGCGNASKQDAESVSLVQQVDDLRAILRWLSSGCGEPLEGLAECFTIDRLGLPPSLQRCLATTNIIESLRGGVRFRTRRMTNSQNGTMVSRWLASTFRETEKNFRRIMGYRELWTLEAILSESDSLCKPWHGNINPTAHGDFQPSVGHPKPPWPLAFLTLSLPSRPACLKAGMPASESTR